MYFCFVIEYAKKQSQPTWCFRDSLLHCIALPVTCCFSIGSIISHSFSAFQINLPFFKATIPLTARQQFPGNNPSWVKIFSEKANSHVTNKICGQNYLNWLGDFFFLSWSSSFIIIFCAIFFHHSGIAQRVPLCAFGYACLFETTLWSIFSFS